MGLIHRVTRGVFGVVFVVILMIAGIDYLMGDLIAKLIEPWTGGHLVILTAALFLFYVLLRRLSTLTKPGTSSEELGCGSASERAAPPEASALLRRVERTAGTILRVFRTAVVAGVICILGGLGAGVGYALVSGIPLEDLYFGALWDELIAGRRLQDLVESAYFTDRQLAGGALDLSKAPKVDEFPTTSTGVVTFFLSLKRTGRGEREVSVRTRWHDESGVERRVVRALHPQRSPGGGGVETWASHEVPRSVIARHPGRWTVELTLNGRPAGEFHFRVVSPGRGGVGRPGSG